MPAVPSATHIHTWFNEPIAFYTTAGSTPATYFGIYGDSGMVGVARWDHSYNLLEIGNPRGTSTNIIQLDDHNNPAVLRMHSGSHAGKILAAYEEHPGKSWVSRSPNADSVRGTWTETQLYDGSTYYQSYAHLCQTTDDLSTVWMFFREGQTVGTGMPVTFRISQDGGSTWTANASTVKLLVKTNNRPYFRIAQSGRRIDFLYTDGNPGDLSSCSIYHFYLEVNTAGTQFSVYKADNTLIDTFAISGGTGTVNSKTLPLDVSEGTLVYDGTTNMGWVWDLQYIGGSLYGCYAVFTQTSSAGDTHQYFRASYSGSSWTSEAVCYAGDSTSPGTVGRVPQWIYPDASTGQRQYSPGICLDPSDASIVYVGKKYGNADVRIQKWTKSGTWSKTSDLTGASGNGRINARPFPVLGSSGNAFWWSASSYTDYTIYATVEPATVSAMTLAKTAKESSPVWTSTYAPNGTRAFYLIHEGSGTTVNDISNTYDGSIQGSPTWGSDSYGANLSGFTTSNYVLANALASSGLFNGGSNYPLWMAVLYKVAGSTAQQYLACFGNSTNTTPRFLVATNQSADNFITGAYIDNAGQQLTINTAQTRDASYHTMVFVVESASISRLFFDGKLKTSASNTLTTVTFDRFAIGAFVRNTVAVPAVDCTISAVVVGSGGSPSPMHLHCDLINGQFLGTWAPSSGLTLTAAAGSYSLTGNAATLSAGKRLTAAAGAYSLTGNASAMALARKITAAAGSFALTGNAATLTLDAAGSWDGRIPDPNRTTWSRA